jgi:CheY-like chemotaxis protein
VSDLPDKNAGTNRQMRSIARAGEIAMVSFRSFGQTQKMLIADDDTSVVRLLADHCGGLGFDVETASDGVETLIKAGQSKPDILVVDVNMPGVDGLSVCAHLLDPYTKPLNVIVITGSRDPDLIDRCKHFGAHYARKGPTFWSDMEAALIDICPHMADSILKTGARTPAVKEQGRARMLLVDDDNDVNRYLASQLEKKYRIEVLSASDANQGFQLARRDEPAVIVTDYFMPNGDAQYFLTKLRTTVATEKIPVIVMTGRRLDDTNVQNLRQEICGRPGATSILKKSFDTEELFSALEQSCGFDKVRAMPQAIS